MRIYVINVATSVQRRRNMEKRLKFHGLLNATKFVCAVTPGDPAHTAAADGYSGRNSPLETSCLVSHLKAIDAFLNDSPEQNDVNDGCIIMEDDQVLLNRFSERLAEVIKYKPTNIPLIMLSAYMGSWRGCYDINDDLYSIGPETFSTGCYWISRQYAKTVIETYAKPFEELTALEDLGSELITRCSGGAATRRLLTISECNESLIGSGIRNWAHVDYYRMMNPLFYVDADAIMEIDEFRNAFGVELPRAPIYFHGGEDTDPADKSRNEFFARVLESQLHKYREVHVYDSSGTPPPRRSERPKSQLFVQYANERRWHDPYLFDLNFIPSENLFPNIVPIPPSASALQGPDQIDVDRLAANVRKIMSRFAIR